MINEIPQPRCSSKPWLWGYSSNNSLPLSTNSSLSLSLSAHPLTIASFHAADERAKTMLKWNQIKEGKYKYFLFKNLILLSYPFPKYKQCGAFIRPAFIVQSERVPHTQSNLRFFHNYPHFFIHQHRKIALITRDCSFSPLPDIEKRRRASDQP